MNDFFPNIGDLSGIQAFWFLRVRDILLPYPEPKNGIISDDINLVNGAIWSTGYYTRETGNSLRELKKSLQGDFREKTFTGFVPGDNEQLLQLFDEDMQDERFIVLYKDNTGNYKLIGSPDEYLTLEYKFESGDKVSSRRGFLVTFSGIGKKPDYFYTGTFNSIQAGFTPVCRPATLRVDGVEWAEIGSGDTYNYVTAKFTRTITIEAGGDHKVSFKSYSSGDISEVSRSNVSSVTYYNQTLLSVITDPYTVTKDDIIIVTVTPTNPALPAVLVLQGVFAAASISVTSPDMGGDGRFSYVTNQVPSPNTLSINDFSLAGYPNVATLSLAASTTYGAPFYRPKDNCVYLFGYSSTTTLVVTKINCSTNAITTTSFTGITNFGFGFPVACYNYKQDIFQIIGQGASGCPFVKYNPVTNTVSFVLSANMVAWTNAYYCGFADNYEDAFILSGAIPANVYRDAGVSPAEYDCLQSFCRSGNTGVVFNRTNRKFYVTEFNGGVYEYSPGRDPQKSLINASGANLNKGALCHDFVRNQIFGTNPAGLGFGWFDFIGGGGSVTISAIGAETGFKACTYAEYPDKVLILSKGGSTMRVIDPVTHALDAVTPTVAVGSQNTSNNTGFNGICFNRLKLF